MSNVNEKVFSLFIIYLTVLLVLQNIKPKKERKQSPIHHKRQKMGIRKSNFWSIFLAQSWFEVCLCFLLTNATSSWTWCPSAVSPLEHKCVGYCLVLGNRIFELNAWIFGLEQELEGIKTGFILEQLLPIHRVPLKWLIPNLKINDLNYFKIPFPKWNENQKFPSKREKISTR